MRILTYLFVIYTCVVSSQTRIDVTLDFQTDPNKQYSIYIPSSYDESTANPLMLGLHPLNTNRWNSISWCDTLINFAETNGLLLICPDGGADGKVDDPIDRAFTSTVLDSMQQWYNVDPDKVYVMGFSWGGKTTYTYGLNNAEKFAGFMPIGAAITVGEISAVQSNAKDKPVYIIHGSADNPNVGFAPLRDALIDEGACVETNLLNGVGHTIDFPNRDDVLTTGYNWLSAVQCITSAVEDLSSSPKVLIFPNPTHDFFQIITGNKAIQGIDIYNINGTSRKVLFRNKMVNVRGIKPGFYLVDILFEDNSRSIKRLIVDD